jgi:hypothetical protein
LIIYDLSVLDDNNNELKNKIEKIYAKIKEKPALKGNQVNGNLILLVFFVTMGNSYYIDKNLPDLIELINFFTKYNNIFINNINMSLFIYIFLIININLHFNSTKNKKQFLSYESSPNNNLLYFEFNENDMNPEVNKYNSNIINNPNKKAPFPLKMSQRQYDNKKEYNIPNLYIYDNEDIYYKAENSSIKLLIFQNYLKLYSFYYLSKNKIKFTINLYLESIHDLLLHISNCKKNNEKKIINNIDIKDNKDFNVNNNNNINNIDNAKNLENIKNIFDSLDEGELSKINLARIDLFTKDNITNCFSGFNFLGLSNFVTGFTNDYQVSRIIAINLELIKKSKKWHLQESAIFKDIDNSENDNYSSTENLINSFSILYFILETFGKNNHLKKNY